MNYLKQLWNTLMFTISVVRRNIAMTKIEPIVFLRNGTEDSRNVVASILSRVDSNIKLRIVDNETAANVIIESKTDSLGFLFVGGKLHIYVPLRTGDNDDEINFSIKLFADLLNFIGARNDIDG